MAESDVYRRHLLTYKDGPRVERVMTSADWLIIILVCVEYKTLGAQMSMYRYHDILCCCVYTSMINIFFYRSYESMPKLDEKNVPAR